jgi:hypothetical protein
MITEQSVQNSIRVVLIAVLYYACQYSACHVSILLHIELSFSMTNVGESQKRLVHQAGADAFDMCSVVDCKLANYFCVHSCIVPFAACMLLAVSLTHVVCDKLSSR